MQQVSPIYILSYFFANIATSEQKKRSLLQFFYCERRLYSRGAQISNKRAKKRSLLRFFTAATRNKRCIAFSEPWLRSFTKANEFALYSLAQALRRRNIYVPKGVRLAAPKAIFARSANQQQASKKKRILFFTRAQAIFARSATHRTKSPIFTTKNKKKYKFIGDSK